jgi:hypothetical protein
VRGPVVQTVQVETRSADVRERGSGGKGRDFAARVGGAPVLPAIRVAA